MGSVNRLRWWLGGFALLVFACTAAPPMDAARHRWWSGLGPVLPHDTFPGDCSLCHEGQTWTSIRKDFTFDHEKQTGVPLDGAHADAQCLRCHNDRGPVATFAAKGCAGCHEDVHQGWLGATCTSCHAQVTWFPVGMIERHARTRLPLVGAHAATACHRCHPGARVGRFQPTDTECLSCHQDDLQRAVNPPHLGLGWVDNCNQCHIPTDWHQARLPN
jgi:hypothetical protein